MKKCPSISCQSNEQNVTRMVNSLCWLMEIKSLEKTSTVIVICLLERRARTRALKTVTRSESSRTMTFLPTYASFGRACVRRTLSKKVPVAVELWHDHPRGEVPFQLSSSTISQPLTIRLTWKSKKETRVHNGRWWDSSRNVEEVSLKFDLSEMDQRKVKNRGKWRSSLFSFALYFSAFARRISFGEFVATLAILTKHEAITTPRTC